MTDTTYRKKLIEVALPLEAINKASAREKSIRHGHPSTLHLWWARRPLAACRAVLFSSLVNDPDDDPMYGGSEDVAATERAKLFDLIEDLVLWENSNNPSVINRARLEIARSIAANKVADKELADDIQLVTNAPELPEEQAKYLPDPPPEYTAHDVRFKMPSLTSEQVNHFLAHYAPPVLDPFAGGGSIPLEAQRLGLRAYASDLNPVPVLINKALIEIPPKFAGQPPVNPEWQSKIAEEKSATVWEGAKGLAEDVRYYGKWMRDEAEKRIGHLYPKVKVTQQMVDDERPDLEPYVGRELTVIAWLWAKTVCCPNPACGGLTPLLRSFWLATKKDRKYFVEPIATADRKGIEFRVRNGDENDLEANVSRSGARCLLCDGNFPLTHIRNEGKNGNVGTQLMAIAAEGDRSRVYVSPLPEHEQMGKCVVPADWPNTDLPEQALGFRVQAYGMDQHRKLFSARQLFVTQAYSNLIKETKNHLDSQLPERMQGYSEAVALYLSFALDRMLQQFSTLSTWSSNPAHELVVNMFSRQTLSMTWDFGEINPTCGAASLEKCTDFVCKVLDQLSILDNVTGIATQVDAVRIGTSLHSVVSTDPPYYDNIGYADLSDYFYVWLKNSLKECFPELFGTMLVPKTDELIATPFRFNGDRNKAKQFFEDGLREAFNKSKQVQAESMPFTVYYAFKQSETDEESVASTGWETMLSGLIESGFSITGTWPVRTERKGRMRDTGSNALASSIVLVCRPRNEDASIVTRRDFANALRKELPEAIKHLQSGNVAPVDLAQASIGPGMAVFSRYSKVVNADGSPMSVREALQMINQMLDESLAEQESDFDAETRFALRWFEQYGMEEGPFGDAETLAKAMAVAVSGVVEAGIAQSGSGKVKLVDRKEMEAGWDPRSDPRLTMWESTQHLIRRLINDGESGAADLLTNLIEHKGSSYAESVRELSYRLYQTCDRAKRAEEARNYNGLVVSWPEVSRLARERKNAGSQAKQAEMF